MRLILVVSGPVSALLPFRGWNPWGGGLSSEGSQPPKHRAKAPKHTIPRNASQNLLTMGPFRLS